MLGRLFRRSIWAAPEPADPEARRILSLLRALAVVDVILVVFGVAAGFAGVPAVQQAYLLHVASLVFGTLVAGFAFAALIGLTFGIVRLEAWAKIGLCFPMALYPILLIALSSFSAGRLAVGTLCVVVIPVLFWRIGDLGRQAGSR